MPDRECSFDRNGSRSRSGRSGIYDQEYLDYLRALVESMREYGIVAYVVCVPLAHPRFADRT